MEREKFGSAGTNCFVSAKVVNMKKNKKSFMKDFKIKDEKPSRRALPRES